MNFLASFGVGFCWVSLDPMATNEGVFSEGLRLVLELGFGHIKTPSPPLFSSSILLFSPLLSFTCDFGVFDLDLGARAWS
jgi:hypothetical protein